MIDSVYGGLSFVLALHFANMQANIRQWPGAVFLIQRPKGCGIFREGLDAELRKRGRD